MTAVLVSGAAVFVLMSFATGALVTVLAPLLGRTRWASSSTPWALAILLPLVAALVGSLGFALPTPFSPCHCSAHDHHPHVCFAHSALAEPLLLPAAALLGVWLAVVLPGAVRLGVALVRSARHVREVRRLPATRVGETDVRFVDAGLPAAFTAGVRSPFIVLDRALWAALTEPDRQAVLHHERGHVDRADTLTALVLRVCLALQPWLPRSLFARWQHAAELDCDRHAAEHVGDASAVAQALVSVGRLRTGRPVTDSALLGVFGAEGLEARVTALLGPGEASPRARRNDVIAILLPVLGLLALVLVWPGDLLHHALETLVGFIHLH